MTAVAHRRKADPTERACCPSCSGWGEVRGGVECLQCHGRGRVWVCIRGGVNNQLHPAHASGTGGSIWCPGWTPPPPPPRPYTHGETRVKPDGTTSTTIRVHRCCNGCGEPLGDPTDAELDAAVFGHPLPDVRQECPRCRTVKAELVHVPQARHYFGYRRRVLVIEDGRLRRRTHQPEVAARSVPADTRDVRYVRCTEHHFACDCREAILSENARESQHALQDIEAAAAEVLAGHDSQVCKCTGCVIAVRTGMPYYEWAPPRDSQWAPGDVPF